MEAGVLPTRNGGQKGFHAQEPHRVLLGFNTSHLLPFSSKAEIDLSFKPQTRF